MITLRSASSLTLVALACLLAALVCLPAPHAWAQATHRGGEPYGAAARRAPVQPGSRPSLSAATGARATLFTENIGQWDRDVRFEGTAGSTRIRFERGAVGYRFLVDSVGTDGKASGSRFHALRTEFVGARPDAAVTGEEAAGTLFNYYLGPRAENWHLGARGFAAVRYHNLYDGIDARYFETKGRLKYEFTVAAGADHSAIALRYSGARTLAITSAGELEAVTPFGTVREAPPFSYQTIGGRRVTVASRYRLIGTDRFGFELGAHDARYPVVIDPCLSIEYSTYLGGGSYDVVTALASDSSGSAYAVGFTRAPDFPVLPSGQLEQLNWVFISKLSPDGTRLIYSTVIAPTYDGPYDVYGPIQKPTAMFYQPIGEDVEVTASGEAVVAFTTNLDSIPTTNGAYQRRRSADYLNSACGPPVFSNFDCYVARFTADGRLTWGTYLGGRGNDYLADIALDGAGNVCLTGTTYESRCGSRGDGISFPTTVPRDRFGSADTVRGFETFVSRLTSDGRTLGFSAQYGGTRNEFASRIAVEPAGTMVILGSTNSTDLPTTSGAYRPAAEPGLGNSVYDVYIARIDPAAGTLAYSTYFPDNGGAGRRGLGVGVLTTRDDVAMLAGFDHNHRRQGLVLEGGGILIFAGSTRSTSLPTTPGALQPGLRNDAPDSNAYDCYLVRLNTATNQVLAATYLGGSAYDALGGIALDRFGDIAVGVSTASHDYPLSAVPLQSTFLGNIDGAVTTISRDMRRMTYSTLYGGAVLGGNREYEQSVFGVTTDSKGALYLFGGTASRDFPISVGAFKHENDYYGGYIVKFSAPTAPKIGAGLAVNFAPNTCGDVQTQQQIIFNSGQTPMRIDSLRFVVGAHYRLINPPSLPFTLDACDTIGLTVAFDATALECTDRARDSLLIIAPEAVQPRVAIPVAGSRKCVTFGFIDTVVVIERYKLGSNRFVGFGVNVRGDEPQYLTLIPDPSNAGIFTPPAPIINAQYPVGTSNVGLRVNAVDTGYYCESFTAIVEPCHRVRRLKICAHVKSGIFTAAPRIDYGLISCKEIDEPFVVRNTGNDTLEVRINYVGGPNPLDVNFIGDVQKPRRIGPGDSTVYRWVLRPVGVGGHESIIVFQTDEGAEGGKQRWVYLTTELDSAAFRLGTTDVIGGFGEIVEVPVEYESVLEGRVPLEELTFHVRFDRSMLDVVGINQSGTIAGGWELAENTSVTDGAMIKIKRGAGGASFQRSGRLMNLQLKVLRGDSIASPLELLPARATATCLAVEPDLGRLFQLNAECAAAQRLLFSNRRLLKQSMPNPANLTVTIPYRIPEPTHGTLIVYDNVGREALRLIDGELPEGETAVTFDARRLPPGLYYYRLTIGGTISETRTMVIER